MPYGGGRNNTDAAKLLHRRFQQKKIENLLCQILRRGREIKRISLLGAADARVATAVKAETIRRRGGGRLSAAE